MFFHLHATHQYWLNLTCQSLQCRYPVTCVFVKVFTCVTAVTSEVSGAGDLQVAVGFSWLKSQ